MATQAINVEEIEQEASEEKVENKLKIKLKGAETKEAPTVVWQQLLQLWELLLPLLLHNGQLNHLHHMIQLQR